MMMEASTRFRKSSTFHLEIDMTSRQKMHIDALFENCKAHLDSTDEFWKRALEFFARAVHASGDDPEMMEYGVKRIKELEDLAQ